MLEENLEFSKSSVPKKKDVCDCLEGIGNKIHKLVCKHKGTLSIIKNKKNHLNYAIYNSHEDILKAQVKIFLSNDNSNTPVEFISNLVEFINNKVLLDYKNLLNRKSDNFETKISEEDIEKHMQEIGKGILNVEELKRLTGIDMKLDIYDSESIIIDHNNIEENINSHDNLDEIIKEIKKSGKYIFPNDKFNDILNLFFEKVKQDCLNIFGICKLGDMSFSEGTHKYCNLETIYKYDSNLFLFTFAINKVLEKNIEGMNSSLLQIMTRANSAISRNESDLIIFNSLHRHFDKINLIKR